MKYLLGIIMAGALAFNVSADDNVEKKDSFVFTDVKVVKVSPVRDQNKTGTCWCFSTNSFFEEELLRKGGPEVDLSEMFVVRKCYLDKARKYILMDGATNFAQGGAAHDVPYVMGKYGMMPEEAYKGLNYGEEKHVHGELAAVLKAYLDAVLARRDGKLSTAWERGFEAILDAYLGAVPETFTVDGKTYTPESWFATLNINPDDYMEFTSYTHHPFYKPFALEVADNWVWGQMQNVPMEELKEIVDNAIDKGYPVAWGADVSEGGFKWKKGYALIPVDKGGKDLSGTELSRWTKLSSKERQDERYNFTGPVEEITVTQEMRQDMLNRKETTDDHGMVIVGKAVDQKGNKYYKVQNSWDTNQVYDGFIYVSEPYFLAKTLDVMVHKDAVPSKIMKKLK